MAATPLFFELSSRIKLEVRGGDALRFLNGQLTNDVRKSAAHTAIEACVLNTKGKIDAHVFIRALGDGSLLDAEPEHRDALQARLDRYIIADDVTLTDVTNNWSLFHVIGESEINRIKVAANRFGVWGHDILVSAADHDVVRGELQQQFVFVGEDAAEIYRIEQGIPRWGRELTADVNPTEANLEERAIDFAKGCYIGQEVISRMKMSGQTNKRLCGLTIRPPSIITAPARLRNMTDGKDVGWITSVTRSERLNATIALGFVKRGFDAIGTSLRSGEGDEAKVDVVALPFR